MMSKHPQINFCILVVSACVVQGAFAVTSQSTHLPIAVLAALDSELRGLKWEIDTVGRSLDFEGRPVWRARFQDKEIMLAKTGSNPAAAEAITRWMIAEWGIRAIISIGPAGALSDTLEIGDVVIAGIALDANSYPASGYTLRTVEDCTLSVVSGVLTVNRFIASEVERDELIRQHGAAVVDMSAASIAKPASEAGIPCIIIREISDRADKQAPRMFIESVQSSIPRTVPAALCSLKLLISGDLVAIKLQGISNE